MIDADEIVAILLAAGTSERFGHEDKLLAPLAGEALALHAARRITELAPARRIAVCRDADGPLARQLRAIGFDIAVNPNSERGLSQSLAMGIGAAVRGTERAALVCLADMPFVGAAHLRRLLARLDPVSAPVVASTDGDAVMPPALFDRSLFDALCAGEGDRGGKRLLAGAALVRASTDELADIDRPQDLRGT